MRVKSIMYISPVAESLDKAREEHKAVRRGGAIEGVLGFPLSEDSWASVSGSGSMPRIQRAPQSEPLNKGCACRWEAFALLDVYIKSKG